MGEFAIGSITIHIDPVIFHLGLLRHDGMA